MPRARNNPASKNRRKKTIKLAAGYRGSRHRLIKTAQQAVEHSGQYAYRDRKARKRDFRRLWIARINAGARANGMNYNRFMEGLRKAEVGLDRKVLAELAVNNADAFTRLVDIAKAQLAAV